MAGADPIPALRCESCGYPFTGLDPGAPCPECGKPLAESLPSRRPGVPWQRGPGVVSWFATLWRLIASPRRAYTDLRIEPRPLRRLLFLNTFLGSIIALIPAAVALMVGDRHVRMLIGPGTYEVLMDSVFPRSVFLALAGPLLVIPAIRATAWYYARSASREVSVPGLRATASLTSFMWVLMNAVVAAAWFLPRFVLDREIDVIANPQRRLPAEILYAVPQFLLYGVLIWAGVADYIGGRANRYANEWTAPPPRVG